MIRLFLCFNRMVILFGIVSQQPADKDTQQNPAVLRQLASEVKNELVNNILPFWSEKMIDYQQGGFFGGWTEIINYTAMIQRVGY